MNNYDELKPLLMLDPLLLPLLVGACPNHELPVVFSVIPTYLSAAMILKAVSLRTISVYEVRYNRRYIFILLHVVQLVSLISFIYM